MTNHSSANIQASPKPSESSPGAQSPIERLRQIAVHRVLHGESPQQVMREMGFNRSSIYPWLKRYQLQGEEGLKTRTHTGRRKTLQQDDMLRLAQSLCDNSLWTPQRLAQFVVQLFQFKLGQTALFGLLQSLGLSNRRLSRLLEERKSPIVDQWLQDTYPALLAQSKKGRTKEGERTSLFFLRQNKIPDAKDLYTLSAVTTRGQLQFMVCKQNALARTLQKLITELLSQADVLLIVDNAPTLHDLLLPQKMQRFVNKKKPNLATYLLPSESEQKNRPSKKNEPLGPRLASTGAVPENNIPAQSNIEAWVLLLNQSLLDPQYPLGDFLAALGHSLGGPTIIASNLYSPASFIRAMHQHKNFGGMNLEEMIEYNRRIAESWPQNPFLKKFSKAGELYVLSEFMPLAEQKKNAYCQRWIVPWESDVIGLCIRGPSGSLSGLFTYLLPNAKEASQATRNFIQQLRPHLETALELTFRYWRSQFTAKALEEATDHLEIAAFVLDGNSMLIESSGAAQAMLQENFPVKLTNHQLQFSGRENQRDFAAAVQQSIAWRQAPLDNKPVEAMRFEYPQGRWFGVLVQPISPPSLTSPHSVAVSPHVIVYVSNPDKPRASAQHQLIVRLFQLSEREAYLTTLLTDGQSIDQAAKTMGITPATARTYLQRIYEKVGVRRRQDLIQRVTKSVALLV